MDLGTQRISHYGSPRLKLPPFPVPYLSQVGPLPGGLHHPDWPALAEHPHGYGRPTGTDPAKSHYQWARPLCSEGKKGQAKTGLIPIHEATSEETSKMLLWNTGHTQSSVWNMGSIQELRSTALKTLGAQPKCPHLSCIPKAKKHNWHSVNTC